MQLAVGTTLVSRKMGKTVRRIAPQLRPLKAAFQDVPVSSAAPMALMITLSELPSDYAKEIPNRDNIFQYEVGFFGEGNREPDESELLELLYRRIAEAVELCPLEENERTAFRQAVENWGKSLQAE